MASSSVLQYSFFSLDPIAIGSVLKTLKTNSVAHSSRNNASRQTCYAGHCSYIPLHTEQIETLESFRLCKQGDHMDFLKKTFSTKLSFSLTTCLFNSLQLSTLVKLEL